MRGHARIEARVGEGGGLMPPPDPIGNILCPLICRLIFGTASTGCYSADHARSARPSVGLHGKFTD